MGTGFGVECARYSSCALQKIRDHRVAPIFSSPRVLPPQNRSPLHSRRAESELNQTHSATAPIARHKSAHALDFSGKLRSR
jgi:hypothetical protein